MLRPSCQLPVFAPASPVKGTATRSSQPESEPGTHGERDSRTDDGERAEAAGLEGGDVHGAAAAPAVSRLLAQQLGHQQPQVGVLGDVVAVASVRPGDEVVIAEGHADADARRLHPDVRVDRALELPTLEEAGGRDLELPDADHPAVHLEERLAIRDHACHLTTIIAGIGTPPAGEARTSHMRPSLTVVRLTVSQDERTPHPTRISTPPRPASRTLRGTPIRARSA
jgi:hypothetical protein